eukprot:TRINITY_DN6392_c0_g1_i1.p1 TRINITY_DN6392_c0_g1~~TRINITY_DN6392_c0_g1_i1.p1  ORF type:complete len:364 (+),score=28.65 TRINITY_DN6392_c0_g1_i1:140-1231(+)
MSLNRVMALGPTELHTYAIEQVFQPRRTKLFIASRRRFESIVKWVMTILLTADAGSQSFDRVVARLELRSATHSAVLSLRRYYQSYDQRSIIRIGHLRRWVSMLLRGEFEAHCRPQIGHRGLPKGVAIPLLPFQDGRQVIVYRFDHDDLHQGQVNSLVICKQPSLIPVAKGCVRLYHGTRVDCAHGILSEAPRLNANNVGDAQDFGTGFYLTSTWEVGVRAAIENASTTQEDSDLAVIVFDVEEDRMNDLERWNPEPDVCKQLIWYGATNTYSMLPEHNAEAARRLRDVDIVYGAGSMNNDSVRGNDANEATSGDVQLADNMDQYCFRTHKAVDLLRWRHSESTLRAVQVVRWELEPACDTQP